MEFYRGVSAEDFEIQNYFFPMKPPLILHCNFVEQGQSIDQMCDRAVDWGYDGIEFRRQRAGVTEQPETYLDAIARAVTRSGLRHVTFGVPTDLMEADAVLRKEEIQKTIAFFRLALERFKLTVCNAFAGPLRNPDKAVSGLEYTRQGSAIAEDRHWIQAVEGLRELGAFAQANHFRLALETHMTYLHDTPQATLDLLRRVDSPGIGMNLDYGNAMYFPGRLPLAELIPQAGPMIFCVHLKNSLDVGGVRRQPTALGAGEINHREYLRLLQGAGYSGPLCLESPRPGDREAYAPEDIAYVNRLLADLGWK
jgi:sugar phosphate isomerase/epimerase